MPDDMDEKAAVKMKITEDLERYYTNNGLGFDGADIFLLGHTSLDANIDRLLRLFLQFRDAEGNSPIAEILAIMPPFTFTADECERVRQKASKWLTLNNAHLPPGSDPAHWFRLVVTTDLRSLSVVEFARSASKRSVVIVLSAANFFDQDVDTEMQRGSAAYIAEDIWVPQLHALCSRLVNVARDQEIHVVIDSGKLSPRRQQNQELLESIEYAGVMGVGEKDDGETYVAENLGEWQRLLSTGHIGQVLTAINSFEAWSDTEKALYRIQMLDRAGMPGQALEEIEKIETLDGVPPLVLVRLSIIAGNAGATVLATRFLEASVDRLNTADGLLMALDASDRISSETLGNQIATKIETLIPGHIALKHRHLERLRESGEFGELAKGLDGDENAKSVRDFFLALANVLPQAGIPSYADIRRELEKDFPKRSEEIRSLLARDALRRKLPFHALDIISPINVGRTADAHLFLDAIEFLVVGRSEGAVGIGDQLKSAVAEVIRYLAENPDSAFVRTRLSRILSVDVAGTMGLALVASVTLDFMRRPLELTKSKTSKRADIDIDQVLDRSRLEKALSWLDSQGTIVLGQAVLPKELLGGPADELAEAITIMIEYNCQRVSDEGDIKTLMMLLTLGSSINPHTESQDYDLPMIRLVAGVLASVGRVQSARDLAEQVLRSGLQTPQRRRVIWSLFADIYLRVGNTLESLIAFACAAAGDNKVDGHQIWHETNGLVRILRGVGLFSMARDLNKKGEEILQRLGLSDANAHRQRFMSFSIDMAEAMRTGNDSAENVSRLLRQATLCAKEALARDDNADPVAVAVAQLIEWARRAGVPISDETIKLIDSLHKKTSKAIADLVSALVSTQFDAATLLRIHQNVESARYAEDAGFDFRHTAIASHRLLATDELAGNFVVASFAIELLADRAISRPGWETTARPLPLIASVEEPAATAEVLSTKGMSFVLVGVDSNNELARVTWQNGAGQFQREPADIFSVPSFRKWAGEFPYLYGVDDGKTANLFYTSTQQLQLSQLPDGPVTIIADTELQQIPPNLFRVGEEFAGQTRPMSASPSLSWLKAAHAGGGAVHNGRLKAWISQEDRQGATLVSIAEWLAETFEKHGIDLDGSAAIPDDFAGSELVIVAAHGGLGPDDRYFQRVSDEGELSVSARELAGALRNVGVVILFVCSGGRADKMPGAVTTVGLSKKLLDQGCSAVIASPWPLDPRVTYQWLPTFLDAWKGGLPLAEATFIANRAVEKAVGFVPEKCLAMTVYGDPMLSYKGLQDQI